LKQNGFKGELEISERDLMTRVETIYRLETMRSFLEFLHFRERDRSKSPELREIFWGVYRSDCFVSGPGLCRAIWSFYIFWRLQIWPTEVRLRYLDKDSLKLCQPRTLVRGSGFSNPRERSVYNSGALALVASRPSPIPKTSCVR